MPCPATEPKPATVERQARDEHPVHLGGIYLRTLGPRFENSPRAWFETLAEVSHLVEREIDRSTSLT